MKLTRLLALGLIAMAAVVMADDTGSNTGRRGSGASGTAGGVRSTRAETGLVGIKLYDTGVRVIQLYGNPIEVQAVGGGGSSVGPSGGGGAGAPGRPAGGGNAGGGQGPSSPSALYHGPFDWANPMLDPTQNNFQAPGQDERGPQAAGQAGGPSAAGQAGGPAGAGGGAAGGGANANGRILYTRWVYRVGNSRYGFILNRFNQVIQIEAIGSSDRKVSTNRGIRYGSTFGDIIKRYGAPDAYEISGDSIVVRYLVQQKVAFRLNRLETNKPHVVTGVVVAAGKQ